MSLAGGVKPYVPPQQVLDATIGQARIITDGNAAVQSDDLARAAAQARPRRAGLQDLIALALTGNDAAGSVARAWHCTETEMSVMERTARRESTLPIYHRSIDWDALYKRYPVPDVFEHTRWRWSADEIRAFQNEQFLDLMKTGWQNEFYKRRWTAGGLEPGDIKSIDDIVKLPMFNSADIKKDQEENPPFGLINGDVRQAHADDADEAADQRRHHRQAAARRSTRRRNGS